MTKLTASAASFIRKERQYLHSNSRSAARRFVSDVADVVRLLDEFPMVGSAFDLLTGTALEGVRRWVKGNYTFDYEIDIGGEPVIILIRHHAQNDPFLTYVPDDDDDFD